MADPTVLRKLSYKGEDPVLVIGAPVEYRTVMAAISGTIHERPAGRYAFVQAFARTRAEVEGLARVATESLEGDGRLWLCYPKKSSKRYKTDLSRDDSWAPLGALGFEPVTLVAIDEDWSAMRFRRAERIKSMTRSRALSEAGKKRIAKR